MSNQYGSISEACEFSLRLKQQILTKLFGWNFLKMGGLLAKADAKVNAVVHRGAAQGYATVQHGAVQGTVQHGAVQGYAGVHSGAIQGNATIERGAAQATVEQGAFQGYAGIEQGAFQSYAAIQPGAAQGTVERGAVSGQANVTGIQRGTYLFSKIKMYSKNSEFFLQKLTFTFYFIFYSDKTNISGGFVGFESGAVRGNIEIAPNAIQVSKSTRQIQSTPLYILKLIFSLTLIQLEYPSSLWVSSL